jgi:hypothetical protein
MFYFYQVYYQKAKEWGDTFDLGVFSNLEKAKKKIEQSKKCAGFKDDIEGFSILKFGVHVKSGVCKRKIKKLFFVNHEYSIEENGKTYDIWTQFDVFATLTEAKSKINKLRRSSRIGKKYPNNFEVSTVIVDNFSCWGEGFVDFGCNN